jgi:hypothetical protein
LSFQWPSHTSTPPFLSLDKLPWLSGDLSRSLLPMLLQFSWEDLGEDTLSKSIREGLPTPGTGGFKMETGWLKEEMDVGQNLMPERPRADGGNPAMKTIVETWVWNRTLRRPAPIVGGEAGWIFPCSGRSPGPANGGHEAASEGIPRTGMGLPPIFASLQAVNTPSRWRRGEELLPRRELSWTSKDGAPPWESS